MLGGLSCLGWGALCVVAEHHDASCHRLCRKLKDMGGEDGRKRLSRCVG